MAPGENPPEFLSGSPTNNQEVDQLKGNVQGLTEEIVEAFPPKVN